MTIYLLQDLLSEAIVRAIGWTLVHSLWQGTLLALLAGMGIMLTRRCKPSLRYSTLVMFLIVFVAVVSFTFFSELNQFDETITAGSVAVLIDENNAVSPFISQPVWSWTDTIKSYFNQHALWIVCGWFFVFLLKSLRLAMGLTRLNRLRNAGVSEHPFWQERMNALAVQLRLKVDVILKESSFIKVPVVLGILKPVVLVPAGMFINLPASQVEAILLHELAHIRRKDYLVNLVQCLCESVFFFNPAVLWISARVREERENCCDDMAIGITGNKTAFIQALVSFHQCHKPMMATAFPGQKYPVLQRVKRIVYNHNKNLNVMEKIFITGGLLITATLGLAFSINQELPTAKAAGEWIAPVKQPTVRTVVSRIDTVPKRSNPKRSDITGTITSHSDGKDYTIVLKNNVIKGLFIDSEPIPSDQLGNYKSITDRLIQERDARSENARKESEQLHLKMKELHREQSLANKMQHELHKKEQLKHMEGLKMERDQLRLLQKERDLLMDADQKIFQDNEEKLKKLQPLQKELELLYKEKQQLYREQLQLHKDQALAERKTGYRLQSDQELQARAKERADNARQLAEKRRAIAEERAIQRDKVAKEREEVRKSIVNELYEDKIISDKKSVSIQLNDEELIVNGVKQPESVHKKYKEKLSKEKNTKRSTGVSESVEDPQ
jgi:bla regulator protein blaR1